MNKFKKITLLLGALVLIGQGCVSVQFGAKGGADGGIWKTADRGNSWFQKVVLPAVGSAKSIANVNTNSLTQDPSDPQAIYIGTNQNGLLYSYDGGESWNQVDKLSLGRVELPMIDPRDKCTIFVAQGNKLLKSVDCARTFNIIYFDARPDVRISSSLIHPRRVGEVFIGTSAGNLLKSADGGLSWATLKTFPSQVQVIVLDPFSNVNFYLATKGHGIWKSTDEGKTWQDLSPNTRNFIGSNEVSHLVQDIVANDSLFLVSKHGLLHSADGGLTWKKINLLTPPLTTVISSFAINPKNPREMYYGTATTFYKTTDGGDTWSTKRLPSSRAATALVLDYSNSNVLYMGVTQLQK